MRSSSNLTRHLVCVMLVGLTVCFIMPGSYWPGNYWPGNYGNESAPPSFAHQDETAGLSSGPSAAAEHRPVSISTFTQPAKARVAEAYDKLPLILEANRGQTDARVKFLSRGSGYQLFLTSTEATLRLRQAECGMRNQSESTPSKKSENPQSTIRLPQSTVLRLKLVGARPSAQITGLDELPSKSHYFIGSDPRRWRTNVPHYAKVRYAGVYPGVDLIYYGQGHQLEYDLVVAPGADLRVIKLAFQGAEQMSIDATGDLVLRTAGGEIRQHKPVVYQEAEGGRQFIAGRYVRQGDGQVGFEIAAYDASRPLVIDPVLSYSTYLGGSDAGGTPGDDRPRGIAVDASGNAYVTGRTDAKNFPVTTGALQTTFVGGSCTGAGGAAVACTDAFIVKLNAAGALVYSTYVGGNGTDEGNGVAVDGAGNAYVTGATRSTNFPTTAGARQTALGGVADAFVLKLNPAGSALVYSTYLGGGNVDQGFGIAVDASGNAYVAGDTNSTNFPTTPGVFQSVMGGGPDDAFVSKLNAAGSALVYSAYLGGSLTDFATGIAVDSAGQAYVTGDTNSVNFPVRPGAFQLSLRGKFDAFVTKVNAGATALLYSTYLGGSEDDDGNSIAVDAGGNVYVTGRTASNNFPTTPGAFQTSLPGSAGAFVTRVQTVTSGATSVFYSTYLGGSGSQQGNGIAADSAGNAYVTGATSSSNFPVTAGAFQTIYSGNTDAFITRVSTLTTGAPTPTYSTYLGGSNLDQGMGIAVDSAGNVYVAGVTTSSNYPTARAFQTAFGGGTGTPPTSGQVSPADGFVAKISLGGSATVVTVSAASFAGAMLASESIVAAFGVSLATGVQTATTLPLPTALGGTTVKVRDSAGVERLAPLFFVSPGQVNYQIPPGTLAGLATVVVTSGDGTVTTGTVQITAVAPALFSANNDGQGVAAAVALRVKADGSQSFEPVAQFNGTRFVSAPLDLGPESDQVFLILFGTGIRFRSSMTAVTAKIGGVDAPVLFAGPQGGFVGLDQINLAVPRSLIGRGEVDLILTVDGQPSNTVRVNIR